MILACMLLWLVLSLTNFFFFFLRPNALSLTWNRKSSKRLKRLFLGVPHCSKLLALGRPIAVRGIEVSTGSN